MELIDRNNFIAVCEILADKCDDKRAFEQAIWIAKDVPTIEAMPVVHGEWRRTGQSFINPNKFRNYCCSECGYEAEKIKYNYCPNCGALLDGERKDDE